MDFIKHEFVISALPERVIEALTSGQKISRWWTTSAELKPEIGAIGIFEWPGHGWAVKIQLMKFDKDLGVQWKCLESNMQNTSAWVGTTMSFQLHARDKKARLTFVHSGYKESPCKAVCNDGWRFVLGTSLKNYLETGVGLPYGQYVNLSATS